MQKRMRVKATVEKVRAACEVSACGWEDAMVPYCGHAVSSYEIDDDGDYLCKFDDGDGEWYFPPEALEEIHDEQEV